MLSECGIASRKEIARAVRAGQVTMNGITVQRSDVQVDPNVDAVIYGGSPVRYRKYVYIMLNKPDGYVSATDGGGYGDERVVTELLPEEYRKMGVFPCGRLDKHTVGLMLLTNDGSLSHRLLSPKNHVAKRYAFSVKFPMSSSDVEQLQAGVDIGGYVTKPCTVSMSSEKEGTITITEGKYHQIKLMMGVVHNQVVSLERRTFGPLMLDPSLPRGAWRELTDSERQELMIV